MGVLSGGKRSSPTIDVSQVQALELDKIIVGAINGPAAGLGMVTALMCDIRFASPSAKFTTSFAKRGLVAEHGISWILPRVVGTSRAFDLLVSSRVVLAPEAKEMGLVNFISKDDASCLQDAIRYARDACTLCSPVALAEIKRQVYDESPSFRADSQRAGQLMVKSFSHPDFKEGVQSLVQKRNPNFVGMSAGKIRDL